MSAICGIYRFNLEPVLPEELKKMSNEMTRLGPDGTSIWYSGSIGFSYQAFHLTQEDIHETLPYYDASSRIAITADCRLDNRAELCGIFGFQDEPHLSDGFLILQAYQKWGKDCPSHLLGEFAVVLWDENKQELIFFVDHTGQRAFFYYQDAGQFAFATESKALHTLAGIERKPNLHRIACDKNTGYLRRHPEITFYENIFMTKSRTLYHVKNNFLHQYIYWQPDINQRLHFSSENEYIEAFQSLFFRVVQSKLRSHWPVFTLHSGGLDSSSVTAMAAHVLARDRKELTALSAVLPSNYQGNARDESRYMYLLQKSNLKIQEITDSWRGPFDMVQCNDMNGLGKSSRYYLYQAFATAASSRGARIVLDGCYGEKGPSFTGNGYFAELLLRMRWITFLRESFLHSRIYQKTWRRCLKEAFLPILPAGLQAKSFRWDILFSQQLSFIKPSFIRRYSDPKVSQKENMRLNVQYPNHRFYQYLSMSHLNAHVPYVLDDHGKPVHFSYPYNDKRILEFSLALPGGLKVKNGYKRYAIRSGMRGLMPDELRFRVSKEPFSPDFHERYNRQLTKAREFVADIRKTSLIEEIIDVKRLESELRYQMQTNDCLTAGGFTCMHMLPSTISLMAFLESFN